MREAPRQADTGRTTGDDVAPYARLGGSHPSPAHVPRTQITAALTRADDVPLVVVSAPAGTGKTSAVGEWIGDAHDSTCWVAFEDGETSFWGPVLAALRREGLQLPTGWTIPVGGLLGRQRLGSLVELLGGASRRITVVVDGYELTSVALAREVDALLRRSSGRLRLVLVGRVDPVLLLHRHRLTDSVLELRAPELAFSDDEAHELLRSSGVDLDAAAVHELNHRLSGWAAGLRFAARALAGSADPERYVATVVEQTSDINEFLVGEVLDVESPDVRRFLLDTCVTDMFCAELVESIGGASAVHTMAKVVDRRAFVEPVPGRPECFRYFPFFRNLLLARLSYESPERLVELRRIASRWYRHEGRWARSLGEQAKVGDWDAMCTQLVTDGLMGDLLLEDPGGPLGVLAGQVPQDVAHPAASLLRAATALRRGAAGRERCHLELARASQEMSTQDAPGLELSIGATDALRACLADECPQADAIVALAESLLAVSPDPTPGREDSPLAAVVAFSRGVVALRRGELAAARTDLVRATTLVRADAAVAFRAACLGRVAVADALEGRLGSAVQRAEEALTLTGPAGSGHLDVGPSAHVALAWVGVERCDDRLVTEHTTAARSSWLLSGDSFCRSLVEAAEAALDRSSGRERAGLVRLETAVAASAERDPWVADQLRVEVARLSIRSGDPEQALRVLDSVQLPDSPAAVVSAAAARVERGLAPSGDGWPMHDRAAPLSSQVRALLVEASYAAQQRSTVHARAALARALQLAASERMRRPFRDHGASVGSLLASERELVAGHDWLRRVGAHARRSPSEERGGQWIVAESLTAKELEVLGHLAELLTTDEIAQKMFVSVNTVRTHIRNILHKLGVSRRNAAIRRARELGILEG